MKVEIGGRARRQVDRIDAWWRRNRDKAPDLFKQELAKAEEFLATTPQLAKQYVVRRGRLIRWLLLPKTKVSAPREAARIRHDERELVTVVSTLGQSAASGALRRAHHDVGVVDFFAGRRNMKRTASSMSSPAKTIELSEDLQAFAEERVRAGEYTSVGDVANAALRLLRERNERRRQVREELQALFDEMEAGTFLEPSDEEFAKQVYERSLKHAGE